MCCMRCERLTAFYRMYCFQPEYIGEDEGRTAAGGGCLNEHRGAYTAERMAGRYWLAINGGHHHAFAA